MNPVSVVPESLNFTIAPELASVPELFRTQRWGASVYNLRVGIPGVYEVKLYLAETWPVNMGERVFHINFQGQSVFPNVDPLGEAGFQTPFVKTAVIDATLNLNIRIDLVAARHATKAPMINAISVDPLYLTGNPSGELDPRPTQPVTVTEVVAVLLRVTIRFDAVRIAAMSQHGLSIVANQASELVLTRFNNASHVARAGMQFFFVVGNSLEITFLSPPLTQTMVANAVTSINSAPLVVNLDGGVELPTTGASFTKVITPKTTTMAVPPPIAVTQIPDIVETTPSGGGGDGRTAASGLDGSTTISRMWLALLALSCVFVAAMYVVFILVRKRSARTAAMAEKHRHMQGPATVVSSHAGSHLSWDANLRAWDQVRPGAQEDMIRGDSFAGSPLARRCSDNAEYIRKT